ncbi:MAG: aminotransferase class V-fold PLP-dependent enzyme [Parvularculaceae bacterium]|nr:aminotransferase class V-fold PLP-dependent enzyme [Parvularculaceae bacterium]
MHASLFHPPAGPYFLSHSVGLQPRRVAQIFAEDFITPWAAGDDRPWDDWLAAISRFRQALATVIGAKEADICPQTNISSGLTKVLHAIEPRPGRRKVVLCDADFPTVGFVLAQAERMNMEIVWLQSGPHLANPDAWAAAFAGDVHLVHITHVFSNLGLKTPVAEIVRRAKAAGAITVVDVAQSAGAVRVEAGAWDCDFVTGTSVKYLCGGPGAAFLWVNPDIAKKCQPFDVGWFSHARPFEFDIRKFEYADGAARFWGGTPSVAPYAIARAGIEAIAAIGAERIEMANQSLIDDIVGRLPEDAVTSHVAAGERGSSFVIRPRRLADAHHALAEENIAHDERADGLRFSVHLYNDERDADRLVKTLSAFI